MTSKIVVNNIESDSGINTVTIIGDVSVGSSITATDITATHHGSGADLTNLPAANLTGTVADARISTLTASKLSGALPAISAANLTSIPAANITGTLPAISGANLTGISAGKVLQVKYAVKNNMTSLSTITSPLEISSDLRVTMTPTSASSLMIVAANLFVSKLDGQNHGYRMYKSSSTDMSSPGFVQAPTTINSAQDGNFNVIFDTASSGDRSNLPVLLKVVELAANTNARTYSPFWCITGGTVYLNTYSGGGYFGTSVMTVMEVEL